MSTSNKSAVQLLDEQKSRLTQLQERRTRVAVRIEAERQALKAAQEEAVALYGTADLDELRRQFKERQDQNERAVVDFIMNLDNAEKALADIERQINF